MTRFIHTSDWQVDKQFLQVKDDQKRFRLKQERINVISRISEVTRNTGAEFVVVAGDLFDSPTPSNSTLLEVLNIIGSIKVPVLVIPGNHDYGSLGTVWHRDDFRRYSLDLAPNLKILLERKPFEIDQVVIFPCPLLRKQDINDPTLWLRSIDWSLLPKTKPRVVIAHGGISSFTGRVYGEDLENQSLENNLINLACLSKEEIDYIALGDWHNLKEVSPSIWYSGTPEPDRFDQGESNQRGQVLEVDIKRGGTPQVKTIPTGAIYWHNININFNDDKDLDRFERQINELIKGRISNDLLRIELSGKLSIDSYRRYMDLKKDLENKLIRLHIKGQLKQLPEKDEIEQLTRSTENPMIAQVASQLHRRLTLQEEQNSDEARLTRKALCELFRFVENT